jgi:hypothetical protein
LAQIFAKSGLFEAAKGCCHVSFIIPKKINYSVHTYTNYLII